jgi:uncharacterized protein YjiS (DUF1127 family)
MLINTKISPLTAIVSNTTVNRMDLRKWTCPLNRFSCWNQAKYLLVEWLTLAKTRNELMNLSDRALRDIGLSRCDAEFEASKPFWMA